MASITPGVYIDTTASTAIPRGYFDWVAPSINITDALDPGLFYRNRYELNPNFGYTPHFDYIPTTPKDKNKLKFRIHKERLLQEAM